MFARLIAYVGLDWFGSLGFVLAVARFKVCGSGCNARRVLAVLMVLFDSVVWWRLGCRFGGGNLWVAYFVCDHYTADFAGYGGCVGGLRWWFVNRIDLGIVVLAWWFSAAYCVCDSCVDCLCCFFAIAGVLCC